MLNASFWDRITPAARITNTVLLAFLINLVSAEVSAHTKWTDIPAHLGWWMLLIPISFVLLVLDYRSTERIELRVRHEQRQVLLRFQELQAKTLKRLFELLAEAALYPKTEGSLNIHVFMSRRDDKGRFALVKDRRFFYEREHMPSNYSLDTVYPDEDKLIICEAFNQNTIMYREVSSAMVHSYNQRIKNKVDPAIHWVLACPLHVADGPPMGILCAFGARPFFKNDEALRYFEHLMIQASEIVVWMMAFDRQFAPDASRN